MPKFSSTTLTKGARQFVVQDALDTTVYSFLYFSRLTPQTNVGVCSSLAGAEITTFFAPAFKCSLAF